MHRFSGFSPLLGDVLHSLRFALPLLFVALAASSPSEAQIAWDSPRAIVASDGSAQDLFGGAVSIDRTAAVIGCTGDDPHGVSSGSAYVLRLDGTQWSEEQKLVASSGAAFDAFGASVAVHGDVIVVGVPRGPTVPGTSFVFRFNGTDWVEEQQLFASDAAPFDRFGWDVSVSSTHIIVGAVLALDGGVMSGAAYTFEFDGLTWVETQKLRPQPGIVFGFGYAVSAGEETTVVTSPSADRAIVYRKVGALWALEQELTPSMALLSTFGGSVQVSGDRIIVGASRDSGIAADAGSAFIYRYDGTDWIEEQKLIASDPTANRQFGWTVALDGDLALIGAGAGDSLSTVTGSAYAFRLEGGSWVEEAVLVADVPTSVQLAARTAVAVSAGSVLVGALRSDLLALNAGAAHIFVDMLDCDANAALDFYELIIDPSLDGNGNGKIDGCETPFIRGDLNDDLLVDIADPIGLLEYLFGGGGEPSCLESADVSTDGAIDLGDPIVLLSFLFQSQPPPPAPFPSCALAPGVSAFDCAASGCP